MVSSFDDVRSGADVLLYTLPSTQAAALDHTCEVAFAVFAMTMWHCVCVCFHSFPLKIELEVERTHMTNEREIYFRRYSREGN
jgi:hypothetical protein